MSKLNIVIEVSDGLEIIDDCLNTQISHGNCYDTIVPVNQSTSNTVSDILRKVSVRAKTWSKQKLAEHCNNVLLSHSSFILRESKFTDSCDLYYPHLRVFVYSYEE